MARGTVVGEAVVSQASTDAFREGYDRAFSGTKGPRRGRWVVTPDGLVPADAHTPPARALDAPVMVDRFMEGVTAPDGTDIGSRAKRREYMARTGSADASDFSPAYYAARRAEREAAVVENTKRTVAELAKVERHNLHNAIEALKGNRR